ncbi:MAG: hypothetical protein EAX95_04560 [Candidatus Thorarchaeota archaeon]|nr:hypothetical protein [Candidatus Thorarchaeota archaeon]
MRTFLRVHKTSRVPAVGQPCLSISQSTIAALTPENMWLGIFENWLNVRIVAKPTTSPLTSLWIGNEFHGKQTLVRYAQLNIDMREGVVPACMPKTPLWQ